MLFEPEHSDLQAFYLSCQQIDLTNLEIPSKSFGQFAFTVHRLATSIGTRGHDGSELHASIANYLISLTSHTDVRVALTAIYALGDHGPHPASVLTCLNRLIISERRQDDHPLITCRAIALRILRRLDPEQAERCINTNAFDEYRCTVEHWLATYQPLNPTSQSELEQEQRWIESLS